MRTKKTAIKETTDGACFYWPGPTRLYDDDVDAGAVLMCGEHARALAIAVADSLRHGGHDAVMRHRMVTAVGILNETFRLGIGGGKKTLRPAKRKATK